MCGWCLLSDFFSFEVKRSKIYEFIRFSHFYSVTWLLHVIDRFFFHYLTWIFLYFVPNTSQTLPYIPYIYLQRTILYLGVSVCVEVRQKQEKKGTYKIGVIIFTLEYVTLQYFIS